jgi:hypothetical protein
MCVCAKRNLIKEYIYLGVNIVKSNPCDCAASQVRFPVRQINHGSLCFRAPPGPTYAIGALVVHLNKGDTVIMRARYAGIDNILVQNNRHRNCNATIVV